MPIQGMPDFAQPLVADGMTIFYPFQSGACTLCPDGLGIAESANGTPAFSLELIKSARDYGVLDMTLAARFRLDDALPVVRRRRADAALRPAQFTAAMFRWRPRLESEMPTGFLDPQPLAWNGLGSTRFILKLARDGAVLLKRALEDRTFLLDATVDVEMTGVAPRLPVRVTFDAVEVLTMLRRNGTLVAHEDVVRLFVEPAQTPIRIEGGALPADRQVEFAEALADRIRTRFGRFAAAPPDNPGPHFIIPAESEVPPARFEWDLSEPVVVNRAFTLRLHPLDLVRDFIARHGGLDAVCRTTVVPRFPTGQHVVSLLFNLTQGRPLNIAAAGATLKAPPAPPHRAQAATATAQVKPPASSASVRLTLSPIERLRYRCTPWAVLSTTGGVFRYEADPFDAGDDLLTLDPSLMAFRLLPIELDRSLLDLATIEGTFTWEEGQRLCEVAFTADDRDSVVDLAVPRSAANARLSITAREKAGPGSLTLPIAAAEAVNVGLYSFREYGPQQVTVTQTFTPGQPSRIVELLPEGEPESASQPLLLTSQEPTRAFSYFAATPFHGGFRYRVRPSFSAPAGPWSAIRQPFEPVVLPA